MPHIAYFQGLVQNTFPNYRYRNCSHYNYSNKGINQSPSGSFTYSLVCSFILSFFNHLSIMQRKTKEVQFIVTNEVCGIREEMVRSFIIK